MTEYLYHVPGTVVDVPASSTITLTKSDQRLKLRIDVPDGTPIRIEPPQYRGWCLVVHRQGHPNFQPWNSIAKRTVENKLEYVNAEGKTADEAIRNLKSILDQRGNSR